MDCKKCNHRSDVGRWTGDLPNRVEEPVILGALRRSDLGKRVRPNDGPSGSALARLELLHDLAADAGVAMSARPS